MSYCVAKKKKKKRKLGWVSNLGKGLGKKRGSVTKHIKE